MTFVTPQGEQGEAGNPGPSGEPGTGVSGRFFFFSESTTTC